MAKEKYIAVYEWIFKREELRTYPEILVYAIIYNATEYFGCYDPKSRIIQRVLGIEGEELADILIRLKEVNLLVVKYVDYGEEEKQVWIARR